MCASNAAAQGTAPIDLRLDFDVSYVLSGSAAHYTGTGTIEPLGIATFQADQIFSLNSAALTFNLSITFMLPSGQSFIASGNTLSSNGGSCSVPVTIGGGTGIFDGSTGSVVLSFGCFVLSTTSGSFHINGTGQIVGPNLNTGAISVSPSAVDFAFVHGSPPTDSRTIVLDNETLQDVQFSTSTDGQSWLRVSPAAGDGSPFAMTNIVITADTTGLTSGTYAGTVMVTTRAQSFPVQVGLTISESQKGLALSQSSLRFQAASGSGPPPAQSITVFNLQPGPLTWKAAASTLSGAWLSIAPATGGAGDSAVVSVDPKGLTPGNYYGIVQFSADGATNSPQNVVVVFNVLSADSSAISVQPTGLIFVAPQGSANNAPESVVVANASSQSVSVTGTAVSQQNGLFFTAAQNAAISSGAPARFDVTANFSGLDPGVYTGALELQFGDGSSQEVELVGIVTPAAAVNAGALGKRAAQDAAACTPTKLVPVSTALAQNFNAVAAWPTPLLVTVVDDCGNAMQSGDVTASFSTGDPSLELTDTGMGNWSATWQPRFTQASVPVVITLSAETAQPALKGQQLISGSLQPNTATPAIYSKGVVSTASYASSAPLAPGAFASIFGVHLAANTALASVLPFTNTLGGAQAVIGGEFAPVQYASDGQVNILLPYDLPPNSPQQVIMLQGSAYSLPETIKVAAAQPAVFTQDQSGHGPGAITVVKPDGTQFSADASHPATAGDALVIYCSGLGAVDPNVSTGSASPGGPPATATNQIIVTIGGVNAPVSFAGLTPDFAGLYQVNVTVPSGIAPGASVSVLLTEGSLTSPAVTVAIQ